MWMVRLGSNLPFQQAAIVLQELTGIPVSDSTIQRCAEAIGHHAMMQADQNAERLHHDGW
jgi:hypothetical protein